MDLISRGILKESLIHCKGLGRKTFESVLSVIDEQPTIEAVPVVYCKDCKHWGTGVAGETDQVKCCEYANYMVGENGFCVYGEKV